MEKLFWLFTALAAIPLLWWAYRVRYAHVMKSVLDEYYRREDEGDEDFYVFLGGLFPALAHVPPQQHWSIRGGVLYDRRTMRWVKTARMSDFMYDRLTS